MEFPIIKIQQPNAWLKETNCWHIRDPGHGTKINSKRKQITLLYHKNGYTYFQMLIGFRIH